jgi:putative NADH-flavin reductase
LEPTEKSVSWWRNTYWIMVIAFVHTNLSLPGHSRLQVYRGDVHLDTDVAKAIHGSQAIVNALSSWHAPNKDVLASAMQRLIPAMREEGISRIVSLTGAGAFDSSDSLNLFDKAQHALMNAVAAKVLRDAEDHLQLLRESNLDWTVVRSPIMTESGARQYKLQDSFPLPWQTIHRHAVANCIVDLAEANDYSQQAPFITRT